MSGTSDNGADEVGKSVPATEQRKDLSPGEYDPTPDEIAAIRRWSAKKARTKTPRLSVEHSNGSGWKTEYDHVAQGLAKILLSDAIGCPDQDFREGLISDLLNASILNGKVDEVRLNMGLAIIKDIQPIDAIEAMLACQMFAIHNATITYTQRTLDNRLVEDRAEPCLNRLARTFTTQVEALKRYRSKGEQVVRVERVYVGEGGQAIVGNVAGGAGRQKECEEQIHGRSEKPPALAAPDGTALPITLEANGQAVRERRGAWKDQVQVSRRAVRRSEGKQQQPQTRTFHGASDCGASQDSRSAPRSEGRVRAVLNSGAHEDGKIS